MALKKKSGAATATDGGSNKKKRKEEIPEEVELPVAKKLRKREQPEVEVLTSDEELHDDPELDKDAGDVLDWPQKDMMELFQRIEAQIPENDNKSFATRCSRLEWDEIAFNNYSPNECKQVWEKVTKKLRRFRLLKEMVVDARHWVQKPWTNFYSGSKNQNHPDMPRRPLTQFMLYYMEKKDKVAEQNPQMPMTDVSKLIAEMYKGLSTSKKMKYIRKAAQLREQYNEKMREFAEKHPEMREEKNAKRNSKSQAASKDTLVGCPKPRNPRTIFRDEYLKKHENSPNFDKEAAIQEARIQWQAINEKKHLFYINLALEEEKKYQEAVKQYCEENPGYDPPLFKTVLKKEEILLRDKAAGKPLKPPTSGYSLFSRIMLAECPELREIRPSNRMQEISTRWHNMSDAEKNEYAKRVKYDQERYKLDYATYLESLTEEEKQEELMKTQPRLRAAAAAAAATAAAAAKSVPPAAESSEKSSIKAKPIKAKSNSKSTVKGSSLGTECLYFPGEPRKPPVKAYDLFVKSFKNDTKLSESEAPRFWSMLPRSDKAKFERKLSELKDQYIRDYEKFLKSLDQDELSKYNELQKKNKAIAEKNQNGGSDDEDDEVDSSDAEEQIDSNDIDNDQEDSDSDEDETKKSDSSSEGESSSSSSSNSTSSSSSEDSDSSSDDSDDDDKSKTNSVKKQESSDSDSSD